jgi:hypothetical protein
LKTLLKSVEAIVKQRKGINSFLQITCYLSIHININIDYLDLGGATIEFGGSLLSLAGAELNKSLANNLKILGNLQQKIRDLHDKQVPLNINIK